MAFLRLLNSPDLHVGGRVTGQCQFPAPSKVQNCSFSNHVVHVTRTPSISYSLNVRPQFEENQVHGSSSKFGFLENQSLVDVSLVNKLIKEYTDDGLFEDAIRVYLNLFEYGYPVEEFRFFPCLIKAYGGVSDIEKGRQIHGHLIKLGVLSDIYVSNSLLSMYVKCRAVDDAVRLFKRMNERDSVSWSSMISGFCQSSDFMSSLMVFKEMVWEFGVYPNRIACMSALSTCASIESLNYGKEIHAYAVKCGLDVDDFVTSGLIETYVKCRDMKNAHNMFRYVIEHESVRGNTVVWNVMITGYVSNGCLKEALLLFIEMLKLGIKPDFSTMVAVLVLCSHSLDLVVGKQIHGFILKFDMEDDVRVGTAIIDMYFKCGDDEAGLKIFRNSQIRNLVMWSTVISNSASRSPNEALEMFHSFILEYGVVDSVILLAVLRACSLLALKPKGMEIHGLAVKTGSDADMFVVGALVDMYSKCRDIQSAQKVFSRSMGNDLVAWNAIICGYAQNECSNEALSTFCDMQSERIRPNTVTVSCILSVCAHLSVMILCKEVHCYLLRQGFEPNVLVSNSLIATYARCGDINSSWAVFEKMADRNEVTWNSIISGLGMHGHMDKMFILFEKMKEESKPDHATFTALLSACSHAGQVNQGWKYFNSMIEDYKLKPQLEQYTCMVDLLGRAGHLNQAYDLITRMPCPADDRIWGSLLGSCKSHGNERLAELVANHIFKLDPTNVGYRILLANLYEDYGKWNEVTRIRTEIKDLGLKKSPGCSWIEVNNNVHTFMAGDRSHYQSEEIYAVINFLTREITREGYIPQSRSESVLA